MSVDRPNVRVISERQSLSNTMQGLRVRFGEASDDSVDLVSRLDTCLGLVEAGEEGVALEILFANLYEFGVAISAKEAAQLMHAAARVDVSSSELYLVDVSDAGISPGPFLSQVERRTASWNLASLKWKVTLGEATQKPSVWLDLTSERGDGRLILWSSGEVELIWGRGPGCESHQEHRDLTSELGLEMCLDDLERAVQGTD